MTNYSDIKYPAAAASTTTYADMPALVAATGMSIGDQALVTALNKLFMYTGSGWFLIATMTNGSPTAITGASATYTLATDGTATTITAVSTDPEGFALTWSYAVTTGSLGSTATVSQVDNVFTITPSTDSANAGTFGITFSVTDGATGAVNAVSAFSLNFGFDFSTAAFDNLSFFTGGVQAGPREMHFNSDGTKMFVIDINSDAVYQYSLTNGFSMATGNVTYDNLSFSVASQTGVPISLYFNTDGTKMFVLDYGCNVHQYSVTNGFSLASGNVSYDNLSFNGSSQESSPQNLTFNSDGTKMFIVGNGSTVYQYSLSNGFSMASGNVTYDNLSFSVSSQLSGQTWGLAFNSAGTKMYVTGNTSAIIYQYSLTNGFSLASGNVSYDNVSFSVSSQETSPTTIKFNSDATKMFILGTGSHNVRQYSS